MAHAQKFIHGRDKVGVVPGGDLLTLYMGCRRNWQLGNRSEAGWWAAVMGKKR